MFKLRIGHYAPATLCIFSKFFSVSDRESVLNEIPIETTRVVFLDTPATLELVKTVRFLVQRGVEVYVRDHHDEPAPKNERAEQIAAGANALREVLGERAVISNRSANPACSSLVEAGEFVGEGTVIVADSDLDGLTAAMKAAGVTYPELDSDAEVFDTRPRQSAETLSEVGWLAVRALSTLPPFNPKRPEVSENAKAELFHDFVAATQGSAADREKLQKRVSAYELGVAAARKLAESISAPCVQVSFVDTCGAPRYDLNTLSQAMEATGAKVTVVRKDAGPIAAAHGVQYSLAVVRKYQEEIDLRNLVPAGSE